MSACRLHRIGWADENMGDQLGDIGEIYRIHAGTVYRIAYSMLKNKQDAEDATQAVFEKLITHWPPCSDDKLIGWLSVCTRNYCKDVIGSAYRRKRTPEEPESAYRESAGNDRHAAGIVEAVLALPEELKSLVVLYYYGGYSSAEIARFLDQPATTVRTHIGKARMAIRAQLEGDAE